MTVYDAGGDACFVDLPFIRPGLPFTGVSLRIRVIGAVGRGTWEGSRLFDRRDCTDSVESLSDFPPSAADSWGSEDVVDSVDSEFVVDDCICAEEDCVDASDIGDFDF